MAQSWSVSASEETTKPYKTHGSTVHHIAEHIKNTVTLESSAKTKERDERLEAEHSISQDERTAAFDPHHRIGGTNLTVEKGTHHTGLRTSK